MNKECDLFTDLLPLYKDELLSEESRSFIEEHISHCKTCRKLYENMKNNINFDSGEELKSYASFWKKQRTLSGFFLLYAAILFLAWLSGTFFLNSGDAMGYTLLYYYFLLPVISGISSAVYVYYSGLFGLLAGAVMGYLNPFMAAVVFHYNNPWSAPFEKENFIFYLPVLLGIGIGIILWIIKRSSGKFSNVLKQRKEV